METQTRKSSKRHILLQGFFLILVSFSKYQFKVFLDSLKYTILKSYHNAFIFILLLLNGSIKNTEISIIMLYTQRTLYEKPSMQFDLMSPFLMLIVKGQYPGDKFNINVQPDIQLLQNGTLMAQAPRKHIQYRNQ